MDAGFRAGIQRLQEITNLVQEISTLSRQASSPSELFQLVELQVEQLSTNFSKEEFVTYQLDHVAVAAIAPIVRGLSGCPAFSLIQRADAHCLELMGAAPGAWPIRQRVQEMDPNTEAAGHGRCRRYGAGRLRAIRAEAEVRMLWAF
jgi:hypothetical protein